MGSGYAIISTEAFRQTILRQRWPSGRRVSITIYTQAMEPPQPPQLECARDLSDRLLVFSVLKEIRPVRLMWWANVSIQAPPTKS